ncbi:hypothetical protein BJ742DRAFT_744779 [Cladochytrium replicatum]|nr:hypothetical protein BJ742DRAFT_744779 [Cladochytrium replicatum]
MEETENAPSGCGWCDSAAGHYPWEWYSIWQAWSGQFYVIRQPRSIASPSSKSSTSTAKTPTIKITDSLDSVAQNAKKRRRIASSMDNVTDSLNQLEMILVQRAERAYQVEDRGCMDNPTQQNVDVLTAHGELQGGTRLGKANERTRMERGARVERKAGARGEGLVTQD